MPQRLSRVGLVTRVTESDELLDEALAMARWIIEAPQVALETAKRYLTSSASATFDEAFAVEHDKVFDEFLIGQAG
jgi:enoyl-CoA hydratase/carnithine racemase